MVDHFATTCGPAADVLHHLLVPKFAKLAPVPNAAPRIAKEILPGLAMPLHPVGFPSAFGGRFAPPEEVVQVLDP